MRVTSRCYSAGRKPNPLVRGSSRATSAKGPHDPVSDDAAVPTIRTALPGPNGGWLERDEQFTSRRRTRRVYPLVVERGSGARHRGRGRQPLPRLHRRHRRHRDRALPPGSRRRHPGPGRQADPHVGHRLLLRARRSTWPSGWRGWRRATAPKRVFFTNSGAEALEAALKLARWHTGRSRGRSPSSARSTAAPTGPCRCPARSSSHRRGFSPLVPDIHHVPFPRGCTTARPQRLRLRPADRGDAAAADGPAGRSGGHLRRADPGRGRLPRAAARLPAGAARAVRPARHPARRRRGADRHGPHRASCSPSSTGASSRTSSAWPRASPAACRSARSSPGTR